MFSGSIKAGLIAVLGMMAPLQCSQAREGTAATMGAASSRLINNLAELQAALKGASGGETFTLSPGSYGSVSLANLEFSKPVTLVSAKPNAARFEQLSLNNVTNLRLKSIELGRPLKPGEPYFTRLVMLRDCANVVFDRVSLHGSLDKDPRNDGYGFSIFDSRDIDIRDSTIEQVSRGVLASGLSDLTISGNKLSGIQTDGIQVSAVNGLVIEGNRIADFQPAPGDHPDAIQLFTNGTKTPSTGIRITNNVILQTGDGVIQGIFMSDETGKLPYRDALIANNLVYINHWHGISVLGAGDVQVRDNTVLSMPGDDVLARIFLRNVEHARVENNVADEFVFLDKGKAEASHNIFLKDRPDKARLIPNARAGPKIKVEDLVVRGYGHQPSAAAAWRRPAGPSG